MVVQNPTSGGQVAAFVRELIDVIGDAVAVPELFEGSLGTEIEDAWESVRDAVEGTIGAMERLSDDELRPVGLTGNQLTFKMRAWDLHRDQWRSDLGTWRDDASESSLDKLKRVSSKLLRLASTILGSLLSIGALPGVEALREIVDALESLL